jgi:urea transporter
MFQDHAGTGLLFLAGIAIASPFMAAGALMGAVIGPVTAALAGFDREEIRIGIYGFNPVLVGTASLFFLQPSTMTWGLVFFGCVAAAFVTYLMRRYLKFPTYTAPFVVVGWLVIIVAHAVAGSAIDGSSPVDYTRVGFLAHALRGTAEVMFGANIATGVLFIVGIALIIGGMHCLRFWFDGGHAAGYLHQNPADTISLGIYGYNASLAAIAMYLWRKSLLIPLLAAAVTLPLTEFFPSSQLGIPALTAPFVIASWIVILMVQMESVFAREQAVRTPASAV